MKRPAPVAVVVIGAGGHAKMVLEAIRAQGAFDPIGLVDPNPPGASVLGVAVLGDEAVLPGLRGAGVAHAFVAIGANGVRQRVAERLGGLGFTLVTIVHPGAVLSPSARLGGGVVVMARAAIGAETRIDDLAIINTAAVADHDNRIGVAAHLAPGTALAGNVTVGARVLVGVGAAVRPGVVIGDDAVIGVGAAVVDDVPAGAVMGGVPARRLRGD